MVCGGSEADSGKMHGPPPPSLSLSLSLATMCVCVCRQQPLGDMVIICEAAEHQQIRSSLLCIAVAAGMKLLSPEWVVQCLICGEALTNHCDFWFDKKQNLIK